MTTVIDRMGVVLAGLEAAGDPRRHFLAAYRRTTIAVHEAMGAGVFADPDWVGRWDVAFAAYYLDAVDAWDNDRPVPAPWRVAFAAAADTAVVPLRHLLLGMNAHINNDLPQSLLATIGPDEFDDAELLARRQRDHMGIDAILSSAASTSRTRSSARWRARGSARGSTAS